jgi:hypothetical protein
LTQTGSVYPHAYMSQTSQIPLLGPDLAARSVRLFDQVLRQAKYETLSRSSKGWQSIARRHDIMAERLQVLGQELGRQEGVKPSDADSALDASPKTNETPLRRLHETPAAAYASCSRST